MENNPSGAQAEILIVEDSLVEAELLRRTLVKAGYRVRLAKNGKEGLQALGEHLCALVISDIQMPLMDGYELCREIKHDKRLWSIPVILVSVLSEPEDIIKALNVGTDSYLTKPYLEAGLLARIHSLLAIPIDRSRSEERRTEHVEYNGKHHTITADCRQILNLLLSMYENTMSQNRELVKIQTQLNQLNDNLENQVQERTAALRESEEKFRKITESAQDAIIMMGADQCISFWNAAAERIFGYSAAEAMGRELHALIVPAQAYAGFKQAFPGFQASSKGPLIGKVTELHALRKGGEEFPVELSIAAAMLHGQWHAIGIVRDITERKRAEEELHESEGRYRSLFENMLSGFAYCRMRYDDHGRPVDFVYLDVNEAFGRLTGLKNVVGKPVSEIIPGIRESNPEVFEIYGRVASTGVPEIFNIDLELLGKWFDVSVYSPEKGYFVAVFNDISERKQAEKQLLDSEARYRRITEGLTDYQYTVRIENDCAVETTQSPACVTVTGYTAEEFAANPYLWIQMVAPEDSKLVMEHVGQILAGKDAPPIEHRIIRKNGAVRWVSDTTILFKDASGKLLSYDGVIKDITERKQAEIALKHANRALATVSAVNRQLVYATDENELLQAICRAIVEQRGYRMASVGYAQQDAGKTIKIMAYAGLNDGYLETTQLSWAENEHGMGPSGRAIRSGTTQLCQDIANDPHYLLWRDAALQRSYAASIALPLADANGKVFGILTVYAEEVDAFSPTEVDLLEEMAGDLAFGVRSQRTSHERDLALEQNQHYLVQLRKSLEDTVRAIAGIVEMRDPYTAGHQTRVADLAAAIARQMGLPDEQVQAIHLASIVHDLGKIKIPAEILSKPGRISDIEYLYIKTHPQAGYDILKDISFPWPIAQVVLQHHERLDGTGYPQGLKGDAILLEARILSVADVVEAISSHRPYRAALGFETALKEITKQRGIHFDPQVVDACLVLFRDKGFAFKA